MKSLLLPDLGEGLKEAELIEWHVHAGQFVALGTPLVCVETAKALVDIPAPEAGTVLSCHFKPGEVINVGQSLMDYQPVSTTAPTATTDEVSHSSVVGELPSGSGTTEDTLIVGRRRTELDGYEPLHGLRREMAHHMSRAWRQVARVSVFDEVVIYKRKHLLARLLTALHHACLSEPALNAWFQTPPASRKIHTEVRIGLAMAMPYGLIVPVLPPGSRSIAEWEQAVQYLRTKADQRSLSIADQSGATISLSSFGMFGGLHATPMVTPPQVAIVGAGRLTSLGKKRHLLPLSLSFDHRAVTGSEAALFMHHLCEQLSAIS